LLCLLTAHSVVLGVILEILCSHWGGVMSGVMSWCSDSQCCSMSVVVSRQEKLMLPYSC